MTPAGFAVKVVVVFVREIWKAVEARFSPWMCPAPVLAANGGRIEPAGGGVQGAMVEYRKPLCAPGTEWVETA